MHSQRTKRQGTPAVAESLLLVPSQPQHSGLFLFRCKDSNIYDTVCFVCFIAGLCVNDISALSFTDLVEACSDS